MGVENSSLPSASALVVDLGKLRAAGLPAARGMHLPALSRAVALVAPDSPQSMSGRIEQLLVQAIAALDEGEYGDAALLLYGLADGRRGQPAGDRREAAAHMLNRSADAFQRRGEANMLSDIADKILALCEAAGMRRARLDLERRRPAESRLAVQWVERFEAYHRLWTPAWALGADLTAYRSTLLDPARPYDEVGPAGRLIYSQEEQADGYAVYALYRWAWFQWQVRQFMLDHGGMWLLSSTDAETRAADLVYEIGWHVTVFNERDHSWLRNTVSQSRGQELEHFQSVLRSTSTGSDRLREWREWCAECQCSWDTATQDTGRFPIALVEKGVLRTCQVHQVVQSCDALCTLIEEEWLRIADWYHLDSQYVVGRRPGDLYREWRVKAKAGVMNSPGTTAY